MRWSLLQLLLIAASAVTAVSGIEQNDVIHYYDLLDEVEDGEAANKIYHEKNRGLVPQLWPNYTAPTPPPAEEVSCNMAYLQCSYRAGCGLALQKYTLACADLAHGRTRKCSTHCRHTLIALMSTKEGQRLMKCNCSGLANCEENKLNVQSCAQEVLHAAHPDTIVSCTAAQWICAANPQCSTALQYYNRYCGSMFRGHHCSKRCMNSISILRRQQTAAKLEQCYCDGTENFACQAVKDNMQRLCFAQDKEENNEVDVYEKPSKAFGPRLQSSVFNVVALFYLSSIWWAQA